MIIQRDLTRADGRIIRAYDSGVGDALTLLWHHGSPQTGALLEPLLAAAGRRGIRMLSYARPGYGGSSPLRGRDVASAAADVAAVADAFGVGRFAVMGASGGGPHALACAALVPDRVTGVACLASIAPFTDEFDWFAGMVAPGGLRSALAGPEARERFAASEEFDQRSLNDRDWATLSAEWAPIGEDAGRAGAEGTDGLVDDDVAFTRPWGFEFAGVRAPVLIVQGGDDRVVPPAHADRLLALSSAADPELWLRPRDGHVAVLRACPVAMDWLLDHRGRDEADRKDQAPDRAAT